MSTPEIRVAEHADWVRIPGPAVHGLVARGSDLVAAAAAVAVAGDLDEVLDTLTSTGLRRVPDFALVEPTTTGARVACRGRAYAVARRGDEDVTIEPAARGPWADEELTGDVTSVALLVRSDPADPAASSTTGSTAEPAPAPTGAASPGGWRRPSRFARRPDDAAVAPAPAAPIPAAPTAPAAADPAGSDDPDGSDDSGIAPSLSTATQPVEEEALPSYDHLFGATAHALPAEIEPTAQSAEQGPEPAVEQPTEPAVSEPGEPARSDLTMPPPAEDAPAPAPTPAPVAPPAPDGGLIASVPWARAAARVSAPAPSAPPAVPVEPPARPRAAPAPPSPPPSPLLPPSPPPSADGEVEMTVDRRSLAGEPIAEAGPPVLSVLCPAGHASSPHSSHCRVCGREIPAQQPFMTPRPPLGTLHLSTGDVVTLDRGVLFGRMPQVNADLAPSERPHLVKLASPEKDISRNHVEVVLDGWHVLVRDLGSVNGTTVTLPGEEAVRLRPSDQQGIEPGTVITIADTVSFTFEAGR